MKRSKGFTLVELVIVLAVSLIIFSAVSISYTSLDKKRVTTACYQLQGDLRYAQRSAVTEGRDYLVVFDMESKNRYNIRYFDEDGLKQIHVKEAFVPEGVALSIDIKAASDNIIKYGPKGTPDKGRTIYLIGSGCARRITVLPSSGRAEIKEMESLVN